MKTYLKNKKGITLTTLIVTIIVILILAGVGIASIAPGGILEKTEKLREDIPLKQAIEEVHNNLDYKYYLVFGEELGKTEESKVLVEQIAEISIETGIPIDVFTIYYGNNGINNRSTKEIYYRYDKIGLEENYESKISVMSQKNIKMLKGDANLDGVLSQEDLNLYTQNLNCQISFDDLTKKICDIDNDDVISVNDIEVVDGILNGSYSIEEYVN